MKTYEVINSPTASNYIKAVAAGNTLWIPQDERNADYQEYLRYTAWVEAGNDPDEFWEQTKGAI